MLSEYGLGTFSPRGIHKLREKLRGNGNQKTTQLHKAYLIGITFHEWGRGGSKYQKICPRGLWMAPQYAYFSSQIKRRSVPISSPDHSLGHIFPKKIFWVGLEILKFRNFQSDPKFFLKKYCPPIAIESPLPCHVFHAILISPLFSNIVLG